MNRPLKAALAVAAVGVLLWGAVPSLQAQIQQPSSSSGTIAAGSVTNAKLANMANGTVKCRTTAGTGAPEDCTTLPTAASPALTGDVTKSAGSNATTIAANAVTNAKAAQMANGAVKCRTTAGTGNAEDCTALPAGFSLNDPIFSSVAVSTAQTDATSNTSYATITGLSVTLTAGKTYICEGRLTVSAGASGGIKTTFGAGSGLTVTSVTFTGAAFAGTTTSQRNTITAFGSDMANATAAVTNVEFKGSIVVNAGGAMNWRMAQNASNATTTSVLVGSWLRCMRTN